MHTAHPMGVPINLKLVDCTPNGCVPIKLKLKFKYFFRHQNGSRWWLNKMDVFFFLKVINGEMVTLNPFPLIKE